MSKQLMKRLPKINKEIATGDFYFAREGHQVVPLDPDFKQLVGFKVEEFDALRELSEATFKLQEEVRAAKGYMAKRAIHARLRKELPQATKHYAGLFNPPDIIRDRLLAKGGDNFYLSPALKKQLPRPMVTMLKKKFRATDTDGSGSIDKEEFYAAYKKDYGGSRAQSDAEFDKVDANHDGEMDFDEYSEYMAPRLMVEHTRWQREDIHDLPNTYEEAFRLMIRNMMYFLFCCCFLREWCECAADMLRPCMMEMHSTGHFLAVSAGCLRPREEGILPMSSSGWEDEIVEETTSSAFGKKRGLLAPMNFANRHNPMEVPIRTWDVSQKNGVGAAALKSLGGQASGPQAAVLRR
jgi:hypothetical protein